MMIKARMAWTEAQKETSQAATATTMVEVGQIRAGRKKQEVQKMRGVLKLKAK